MKNIALFAVVALTTFVTGCEPREQPITDQTTNQVPTPAQTNTAPVNQAPERINPEPATPPPATP
jgi:outer membrane murein-binding lipoprotein Lpp